METSYPRRVRAVTRTSASSRWETAAIWTSADPAVDEDEVVGLIGTTGTDEELPLVAGAEDAAGDWFADETWSGAGVAGAGAGESFATLPGDGFEALDKVEGVAATGGVY